MIDEWHVAFFDRPGPTYWWDAFTRPGFRHVLAFGFDPDAKVWLFYDPALQGTTVDALAPDAAGKLITGITHAATVILRCKPAAETGRLPRLGFWCVPAICHLLGYRPPLRCALAPFPFYQHLLARGCQPSFERVRDEFRRGRIGARGGSGGEGGAAA